MGIVVKHVQADKKTGRLIYLRAFPARLIPFVPAGPNGKPPAVLKVSMGTKDPDSPRFRAAFAQASARYDTIVAKARKAATGAYDSLDAPRVAYLGKVFEIEWLEREGLERWEKGPDWAQRVRDGWEECLPGFIEWKGDGDSEAIRQFWSKHARTLLSEQDLVVDPNDPDGFDRLCRELNDAAIRVGPQSLAQFSGQTVELPARPSAPEASAGTDRPSRVPMLETFDDYAEESQISPTTAKDWRPCVAHLVSFLGHDDAAKLTRQDLLDWRNALLKETTKRGALRHPKTVRGKYIGSVKAMLSWAVDNNKLKDNVAAGLPVSVPATEQLRERSFTSEEALAILEASLIPPANKLTKGHALARRWIPWLCAYSGARVNELSQLRAEDVRKVDGYWMMNITPEAGKVKTRKARLVPIHSHLIDQGFLAIVEAQGAGPIFYDPSRQRVEGPANRHVAKVGERLAAWVRKDVGIDDDGIAPNHAWRHLFKSVTYSAGIEERMADAIQGHAATTEGRKYGAPTAAARAEAIEKIPRYVVPGL
ncbi:recombinase XerD [Sphingomonas sp. LR55]|uniref:recombinase XerD n=1 Tax=Sphingomonas sp. LR55 TaxID=3050231 RepID=UPI002FE16C12